MSASRFSLDKNVKMGWYETLFTVIEVIAFRIRNLDICVLTWHSYLEFSLLEFDSEFPDCCCINL